LPARPRDLPVSELLKSEDGTAVAYAGDCQGTGSVWLFCDNGSEFTSQAMDLWAYRNGVRIDFSRPGKPTDNAFVESFNGTLRAECLDVYWFAGLAGAKQLIEEWRREYNESSPHRALGEQTPSQFASQFAAQRELTGLQETENSP
jgi:putative transposase